MEVLHKIFRVWENVQFPNWRYATLEISFVTDDIWCLVWYSTGKKTRNIWKTQLKHSIWHFDLLQMAWQQPLTSMVNFMELARVVSWAKMQLTMSEIKDTQFYVQEWADFQGVHHHYNNVIMSAMASQITSLAIVYSTAYSGTDQRKHKSSASLAFVRRIHRWPVNSPHKGSVTRKMVPFDDVMMIT